MTFWGFCAIAVLAYVGLCLVLAVVKIIEMPFIWAYRIAKERKQ